MGKLKQDVTRCVNSLQTCRNTNFNNTVFSLFYCYKIAQINKHIHIIVLLFYLCACFVIFEFVLFLVTSDCETVVLFCAAAFPSAVCDEPGERQSRGKRERGPGTGPLWSLQPQQQRQLHPQTHVSVQQAPLHVGFKLFIYLFILKKEKLKEKTIAALLLLLFFCFALRWCVLNASRRSFCKQHSFLYRRTALPLTEEEKSIFTFQECAPDTKTLSTSVQPFRNMVGAKIHKDCPLYTK